MKKGKKAAFVACSNGLDIKNQEKINALVQILNNMGIEVLFSDYIYDRGFGFGGTGKERADALMNFYKNEQITDIFDISGGDIGNEILPYLDYNVIARFDKTFWGYSDLTTVINAIYAKTGKSSVLYQVRNLVGEDGTCQIQNFKNTILDGKNDLYEIPYSFIQGNKMEGVLVGGNIRCLLKLAGTPYFPDMKEKILLLEARSGKLVQMVAYLSQLKQLGVFEQVNGILLGTFTELERNRQMPHVKDIIHNFAGPDLPIAYTSKIGHGVDSKGIRIGKGVRFQE